MKGRQPKPSAVFGGIAAIAAAGRLELERFVDLDQPTDAIAAISSR